jgi:hypothetical protein
MATIAIPTHQFQLNGLGAGAAIPWQDRMQLMDSVDTTSQQILKTAWGLSSMASFGVSAYYNYRRTDSVLMAVLSGLLGSIFPVVAPAITYAKYKNARGRR